MNYLTYASTEMFSSTDLIRKSKMIFDKVSKKQIEKAVILRDGKPSFMLLDFQMYEEIMNDYLRLKDIESGKTDKNVSRVTESNQNSLKTQQSIEEPEIKSTDDIDEEELQRALEQIEQLDLDDLDSNISKEDKPLKEFWD